MEPAGGGVREMCCGDAARRGHRAHDVLLDAKGVLTGSRATALVTQLNEAPTANPLMKCPSSTIDELWFLETGTTVTAQFWVMLGGCGFASDSSHIVFWRNGDPLTN
jgi:hypothetical protein